MASYLEMGTKICKPNVSEVMKRYIGFLRFHHNYSWKKFLSADGLKEYLDRDVLKRKLNYEKKHKVTCRRVSVTEAIQHLLGRD